MYLFFFELFKDNGISNSLSSFFSLLSVSGIIIFVTIILSYVSRNFIKKIFTQIAKRTSSNFDDSLIENKIPSLLGYLPPLFFLIIQVPELLSSFQNLSVVILNILEA
jgi:hypothetical protein